MADPSQDRALFETLRAARERGDHAAELAAREELVRLHLGLVRHCALRYRERGEPLEDLVQVGSVGLLLAIDRFDLDREVAFSSFAIPTIVGEIRRHFRDRTWSVRVPRGLQELARSVGTARESLTGELGRSPTAAEVAERLGVEEEDVLEAIEASYAYRTDPFDPDPDSDAHGEVDAALAGVEDRETVAPLLAALPARERQIVILRFFEELSQRQIAERMGISQMHVSRLLARSLGHMRSEMLGSVA